MDTIPYHAHYIAESRDCDGRYTHTHCYVKGVGSIQGEDDYDFERRIVGYLITTSPDYQFTLTIQPRPDKELGFVAHASQQTEEGWTSETTTFCWQDDIEAAPTYRDHTAEAAGY